MVVKSDKQPTARQMEVARFFVDFEKTNEYWPTIREAAAFFEISIGAMNDTIIALEKKGILHRLNGKARSMKIGENYKRHK